MTPPVAAYSPHVAPVLTWDGPLGLPRFEAVEDTAFAPAYELALESHEREIRAIADNPDAPTFANTVEALEMAGDALSRVGALFWMRASAHTNDVIRAMEREISPRLSRHYTAIGQNEALFARLDALWEGRAALGLDEEQTRVLERHWKGFVRSGAKLDTEAKERLGAINERLSSLGTAFGQNVLADESSFALHLTREDDLKGLPPFLVAAMESAARERGLDHGHAVTLSRSIIEPFLTFAERRDLRERAFAAWIARGEGANDNRPIVAETLRLRAEKAALLGFGSFADMKLENTMAETPAAVNGLLEPVWERARQAVGRDAEALAAMMAEDGHNHAIEPWDWRFYAERLRQQRYDFSEGEVKPYLQLERMVEAAFDVATRLFGVTFEPRPEIAGWHEDVRAFEMKGARGETLGMFFGDWFARPTKRSGAWMSGFQSQSRLMDEKPFIYNVCNFAKAPKGEPTLLSFDDARTLFHEFGHALHGLLSDVRYPSVSGTGVARDFVELPSQLYEHWLGTREVLERHARHAGTGEPMPAALMDKIRAARNFNAGAATVEYTACAIIDMAAHTRTAEAAPDPMAFERSELERLEMPAQMVMRHRTPHFQHVYSGEGYAAGYYSYMWSEVLDADAFAAFEEAGDVFDPETAARLKQHIYSAGGARDPKVLYTAFRGRMPSPEAMMRKRGLMEEVVAEA